MTDDPRLVDPDYDKHGGFPNFEAAQPGPGFGRFLTAMRRAQDLAVSADPDSDTWDQAADRAEELVKLLDPFEAPEGVGPANRVPDLPGAGSLLMPPYRVVQVRGRRRRVERAVQPLLTSAATMRCTAACCRCCSTRCSAW